MADNPFHTFGNVCLVSLSLAFFKYRRGKGVIIRHFLSAVIKVSCSCCECTWDIQNHRVI